MNAVARKLDAHVGSRGRRVAAGDDHEKCSRVRRLEARSAVENLRGNGALRKLGAVQEGVLRGAFRKGDRVMDAALWTILADDWRRTRLVWRPTIVH